MNAQKGRVTESGRVSLPADMRRAVGLERGGGVVFELEGGEIRIRPLGEVVARAQALSRRLLGDDPDAGSAGFIAERHREARREP
ncbi:MAG TPA: AbrB/MazE/SpoVT family DNA-binding domain-containing protein [Caulobacteraceae bacterium]|nr:AbrB/MazE/SpoVT family DNA-binding domain-containing protein [Caulobacteraceae bacterium]